MPDPFKVLFICTGNSARSIIAELLLNKMGKGTFVAHSAGSTPPAASIRTRSTLLREMGHDTTGLRSKSWLEFAKPGAPAFDFVFTVCDNAAGESCPIWPGQPMTAHWGLPDPAAVTGSPAEISLAFRDVAGMLTTAHRGLRFAADPLARQTVAAGQTARHRSNAGATEPRRLDLTATLADLSRRLAAEAIGTALLLATVVGSGIMAQRLAGGNVALALLGNTLPTGAILVVLILIFGPVSGAHFNPAVSLVFGLRGELTFQRLPSTAWRR